MAAETMVSCINVVDEALSVLDPNDEGTDQTGTIIGITIKLLVFKASVAEQRMSHAPFATVLSLVTVQLETVTIAHILGRLFLGQRKATI